MVDAAGMEAVVCRWEASGLSLRRFGAQEGISYSKLVYWKKKLRGSKAGRGKAATRRSESSPSLVPVQVILDEQPAESSPSPYAIWLGNGIGIDVQPEFDDRELRRLVNMLSSC